MSLSRVRQTRIIVRQSMRPDWKSCAPSRSPLLLPKLDQHLELKKVEASCGNTRTSPKAQKSLPEGLHEPENSARTKPDTEPHKLLLPSLLLCLSTAERV